MNNEYYVAPSYKEYERVGEVFEEKGKKYINIKHPRTGNIRKARAYTEAEFYKAYPSGKTKTAAAKPSKMSDEYLAGLKIARGFKFGPITLVKTKDEEWLNDNPNCWYCVEYGWYVPSTNGMLDGFGDYLPEDLKRSQLTWEEFLEKYWSKKEV